MFTGLIEETGILRELEKQADGAVLTIEASIVTKGTQTGDSIAVNGVCLTVVSVQPDSFTAQAVRETVENTTLASWKPGGALLNLERALPAGARMGGHIVQGHVDGVGEIVKVSKREMSSVFTFTAGTEVMKYIVYKGSIAIDGVSLTIAHTDDDSFSIAVIPHTLANTNLRTLSIGNKVNLETDIIARYVEKFTSLRELKTGLTEDKLRSAGF